MAKILIVDDSPTELHVLGKILHHAGHETLTANDGESGIAMAKAQKPDVVLMDVVMPGLNGFQATRKLSRDPETQQIPVLMVTTKDQDTDREWGLRQGAKGYLVKPVDGHELIDKINELLGVMEKIELVDDPLTAAEAVAALADLEQRYEATARALPQYATDATTWDGLVFSVAGVRVVAAMNEVSEMLPMQDRITRVPGAKDWVVGLANVRGSLLPIIDLQLFLRGKPVVVSKSTRILVLRQQGLVTGLLVPSVQGMRHFDLGGRRAGARMKGPLGAYVYEAFGIDGEVWPVMSMVALAADPAFRSAVVA